MRKRFIITFAILILLIGCRSNLTEEFPSQKAKIFEEYISRMVELGEFNGNVLVAEEGKVIYRRSIGRRSEKNEDTLNLDSQFRLASATKPFTALAVIQLKEKGEISYEDPIKKYIQEWPYEGATIRHLLNHTSGIPNHNYLFIRYWKPSFSPYDPKRIIESKEQMIQMFIDYQPEVDFLPGEEYGYSDTGYILLSIIIERVTGMAYHQYMRENVFLPAGMKDTYVFNPLRDDPLDNRAYGIMPDLDGEGLKDIDFYYLNPLTGANGIYSTIEDLFRWDRILYTDKLISQSNLEEAYSPVILNNGDTINYGFGWTLRTKPDGDKTVSHSGYSAGFGIEIIRELEEQNTIIILTNYGLNLWDGVIQNLGRILREQKYELPKSVSIAKVFGPVLLNEGINVACNQYYELKQTRSAEFSFDVSELNDLGCALLRFGYEKEALLTYQFNAKEFPGLPHIWHSLANCYLYMGFNEKALIYFNKALEIDPDFSESKMMLTWLKKMNWVD